MQFYYFTFKLIYYSLIHPNIAGGIIDLLFYLSTAKFSTFNLLLIWSFIKVNVWKGLLPSSGVEKWIRTWADSVIKRFWIQWTCLVLRINEKITLVIVLDCTNFTFLDLMCLRAESSWCSKFWSSLRFKESRSSPM